MAQETSFPHGSLRPQVSSWSLQDSGITAGRRWQLRQRESTHFSRGLLLLFLGCIHILLWVYTQITPGLLSLNSEFTHYFRWVVSHITPGLPLLSFWIYSHFTPGLHTLYTGFTPFYLGLFLFCSGCTTTLLILLIFTLGFTHNLLNVYPHFTRGFLGPFSGFY